MEINGWIYLQQFLTKQSNDSTENYSDRLKMKLVFYDSFPSASIASLGTTAELLFENKSCSLTLQDHLV